MTQSGWKEVETQGVTFYYINNIMNGKEEVKKRIKRKNIVIKDVLFEREKWGKERIQEIRILYINFHYSTGLTPTKKRKS